MPPPPPPSLALAFSGTRPAHVPPGTPVDTEQHPSNRGPPLRCRCPANMAHIRQSRRTESGSKASTRRSAVTQVHEFKVKSHTHVVVLNHGKMESISTVTEVNTSSTFALRRSFLFFCLNGQRSSVKDPELQSRSTGNVSETSSSSSCLLLSA